MKVKDLMSNQLQSVSSDASASDAARIMWEHDCGCVPVLDAAGKVVGKGDFVAQFDQVMKNLKIAIEASGAHPDQMAVLTLYVTDVQAYRENLKPIGDSYRAVFGKHFPAITLVEVKGLYHPDCRIEISGIAVVG